MYKGIEAWEGIHDYPHFYPHFHPHFFGNMLKSKLVQVYAFVQTTPNPS